MEAVRRSWDFWPRLPLLHSAALQKWKWCKAKTYESAGVFHHHSMASVSSCQSSILLQPLLHSTRDRSTVKSTQHIAAMQMAREGHFCNGLNPLILSDERLPVVLPEVQKSNESIRVLKWDNCVTNWLQLFWKSAWRQKVVCVGGGGGGTWQHVSEEPQWGPAELEWLIDQPEISHGFVRSRLWKIYPTPGYPLGIIEVCNAAKWAQNSVNNEFTLQPPSQWFPFTVCSSWQTTHTPTGTLTLGREDTRVCK